MKFKDILIEASAQDVLGMYIEETEDDIMTGHDEELKAKLMKIFDKYHFSPKGGESTSDGVKKMNPSKARMMWIEIDNLN